MDAPRHVPVSTAASVQPDNEPGLFDRPFEAAAGSPGSARLDYVTADECDVQAGRRY
jgi:hypothetical protein